MLFFNRGPASGTGNLFGHFLVKATSLNQFGGSIGFIVPLSFSCGTSYEKTRKLIYQNYQLLNASHYSKRPNMLFSGIQQRITIFVSRNKGNYLRCLVNSSKLWRWKKEDQEMVVQVPNLAFVDTINSGVIPKVSTEIGAAIYRHIKIAPKNLGELFIRSKSNEYVAYYHNVAMYWVKGYDFPPYFKRENETLSSTSSTLRELYFEKSYDKNIFLLLINSSLFYYWWITQSDEFHVLVSEIGSFGLHNYEEFIQCNQIMFGLVKELMDDYIKNSSIKSTALGGALSQYQEFYPRRSKTIINKIDDFIAPIYGLSEEQNSFLKNYDLSWRTDEE